MAYGSLFIPTAELDAGPATYEDSYDTLKPMNGARNPLGTRFCYQDSSYRNIIVAYVRLNCTTPPASFIVGPVYWKDNTFTIVTATPGDITGFSRNLVAGILLNTTITNGSFTWIVVSGYVGASSDTGWGVALPCPNSTLIGDGVISGTGNQSVALAPAGTPTYKQIYYALTNNSTNKADGLITCEFQGTN